MRYLISLSILFGIFQSPALPKKVKAIPHPNPDTSSATIHRNRIITKTETVYVKQLPHDKFYFVENKPGFDASFWLSMSAIGVSIIAIILPIRASKKADKRAMFFKMYEAWNSSQVVASRVRYWDMLKEHRWRGKVNLKTLYNKHRADYIAYESIFDVLSDTATLYLNGSADKELIAYSFYTFILSYDASLKKDFLFFDVEDKHKIKMGEQFYSNIHTLILDVEVFRKSRRNLILKMLYWLNFKETIRKYTFLDETTLQT